MNELLYCLLLFLLMSLLSYFLTLHMQERKCGSNQFMDTLKNVDNNSTYELPRKGYLYGEKLHSPKFGRKRFLPRVPRNCHQTRFCLEDVSRYPHKYIENILKNPHPEWDLRETVATSYNQNHYIAIDDQQDVCTYRKGVRPIKIAKHVNGGWFYIINTSNFRQHISTVTCISRCKSCENIEPALGYKSICTEEYTVISLHALNYTGGISKEPFFIPSCCTCKLIPNGN